MRQALDIGGLFLIKPNLKELRALSGEDIDESDQLVRMVRGLVEAGKCAAVLVSLGAQGALLATRELSERISAPTVRKLSAVGAGDSQVGAVTLKLAQGASLSEAARYGVAAGSAATMTAGSELCRRADTDRLFACSPAAGARRRWRAGLAARGASLAAGSTPRFIGAADDGSRPRPLLQGCGDLVGGDLSANGY